MCPFLLHFGYLSPNSSTPQPFAHPSAALPLGLLHTRTRTFDIWRVTDRASLRIKKGLNFSIFFFFFLSEAQVTYLFSFGVNSHLQSCSLFPTGYQHRRLRDHRTGWVHAIWLGHPLSLSYWHDFTVGTIQVGMDAVSNFAFLLLY